MPKFKVGDHVERSRSGRIILVIQNGIDWVTEYEIDFGNNQTATFYETQLRLVQAEPD